MSRVKIASFESKTRGPVDVYRAHDKETAATIYAHSSDPGIVRTLGDKDLWRFAPDKFPVWREKQGGRSLFVALIAGHLAATFWVGGGRFPKSHFPNSDVEPPYTAAWRTAYSTPEGGTYEGEGIGKRIALAGIADVVALTKDGGPEFVEDDEVVALPPLEQGGIWIETGVGNVEGQALYHHLGNISRDQEPIGFRDVGIYTPPPREGATPQELESRVGMVADTVTIRKFVTAASALLTPP